MNSISIVNIIPLLIISIGLLFYTLWATKVYSSTVPKPLIFVCVPILSFSAYYLLNMLKVLPAIFVAAGILFFLAYCFLLRLPLRFAFFCAMHLLVVFFFLLSIIMGAISLLYGKNIYHILLIPETARLVFLLASCLFTVFCVLFSLFQRPFQVKAIADNRFIFKYYLSIESLLAVFMLYTCFDYYVNGDSIWPSIWHLASAAIMIAIHITTSFAAFKMAITLQDSVRRDRQNELLAIQQAHVKNIISESDTINRLHHDYNEMLMTVDLLARKAETEKIIAYVKNAQQQLEIIRPRFKPLSNNAIMNSLLFSAESLCESKGIAFDATLYVPESLEISSNDLYSVIQELVKNAIEACEKKADGDKRISLTTEAKNSWLTIKIQNTYGGRVPMAGAVPDNNITSEESYRGFGLRFAQSIVEKNNGIFFCEAKNNVHIFKVSLMFPY